MNDLLGQLVVSLAGRDKGCICAVVGEPDEEGFVLIADGKVRKVEKPKKAEQAAAPKQDDAAIAAAIAASLAAAEDNVALVAAITAAITAARAENGESGSFRVVSFKRAERRRGFGR